MLTMTSALLVGPYDWRPELIPREQYDTRLAALRAAMARHDVGAVIVHGATLDDAALVWLTGFVPKLGPGFAFVPASGDVRLLFAGGPGMQPSASRQTWIADVRALRNVETDLLSWLNETDRSLDQGLGLWDGTALSESNQRAIARTARRFGRMRKLGGEFDALRRSKSEVERALIGRASEMAVGVFGAFGREILTGADVRGAGLAAERAGYLVGAQDVRVLASWRQGGMPLILENARDMRPAATNVYVAVRHAGYWADCFGEAGLTTKHGRVAQGALQVLKQIKPGLRLTDLQPLAGDKAEILLHLNGIGAKLAEAPNGDDGGRFEEGDVCSLWIEAGDAAQAAFASTVFAVERDRAVILSPPAQELPA